MKVRGTNFPIFGFKVSKKNWSSIDFIDRYGKDQFVVLLRVAYGYSNKGVFYTPNGLSDIPISRSTFTKYKDVNTYLHKDVQHYIVRSIFNDKSEKKIKELK